MIARPPTTRPLRSPQVIVALILDRVMHWRLGSVAGVVGDHGANGVPRVVPGEKHSLMLSIAP